MRDEYDFSKATKNPYTDKTNIDYFKKLSAELNIPYQTLINSYFSDCVSKKLRSKTEWS